MPNDQMEVRLATRREWLTRFALPAVAALGTASCFPDAKSYYVERTSGKGRKRRFVPVAVDRDRVIRSTVGLRPVRLPGFRLESEKLGEKQLVHLYGHGGGGMTLSWGSAALAVHQLDGRGAPGAVAVIGAGVIGLTTALMLQRRGIAVTIYAESLPPHTTSNASAATFYPSHVVHPDHVTPEFEARLEVALRTSYHAMQQLVGPRYGVRWLDSYYLASGTPAAPEPPGAEDRVTRKVVGGQLVELPRGQHPFGDARVRTGRDLIIEPPIYIRALVEDFRLAGGSTVVRRFQSLRDVAQLREHVVFNCTGLGARTLVGDKEVHAARGQLTLLPPQPDVDYTLYHGEFYYMVPRQDGIVIGGTYELDNELNTPDQATENTLVENHARVFNAMR